MVTVYTKPQCAQCDATKRLLSKSGVPHTTVDITVDTAARATVMAMGYTSAPVVVVNENTHWSGFRPDRIKALVTVAA